MRGEGRRGLRRRRTLRWTETRRSATVGSSSRISWTCGDADDGGAGGGDGAALSGRADGGAAGAGPSRCRRCRRPLRCSARVRGRDPPAPVGAAGTPGSTRSATRVETVGISPAGEVRTGKYVS
jgi:hypothetical protein